MVMGTAIVAPVLALLTPHPKSPLPNLFTRNFSYGQNCVARRGSFSVKAGGRVGGSEWEKTDDGGGRFTYPDEFNYGYDEEEFGFRKNSGKQRVWWSDDSSTTWWDSDDEDEDEGEDEDEDGGFSSIFKVLRAFGWVVPAIIVSLLLGTGSNAFVMALALPLAQSVLSSVFDMIWERPPDNRRPKSRSPKRKRPFPGKGSSSDSRMGEEKEWNGESSGDYRSWVATDNASEGKAEGRKRRFGGWDELDEERRKGKEAKAAATTNEKKWQTPGKLGRRVRKRTPLLVRLLIAFFPFLGFWTKLL